MVIEFSHLGSPCSRLLLIVEVDNCRSELFAPVELVPKHAEACAGRTKGHDIVCLSIRRRGIHSRCHRVEMYRKSTLARPARATSAPELPSLRGDTHARPSPPTHRRTGPGRFVCPPRRRSGEVAWPLERAPVTPAIAAFGAVAEVSLTKVTPWIGRQPPPSDSPHRGKQPGPGQSPLRVHRRHGSRQSPPARFGPRARHEGKELGTVEAHRVRAMASTNWSPSSQAPIIQPTRQTKRQRGGRRFRYQLSPASVIVGVVHHHVSRLHGVGKPPLGVRIVIEIPVAIEMIGEDVRQHGNVRRQP